MKFRSRSSFPFLFLVQAFLSLAFVVPNTEGASSYYVNDGSTDNDEWCSAPGSDGNAGTNASSPKATVQAILDAYDLEPGDTVRIDTGAYVLDSDITVTTHDEGSSEAPVTFEASPYGVTIDRNNISFWRAPWYINGADYVTIRTAQSDKYPGVAQSYMRAMGGGFGVFFDSEAQHCYVSRVDACSNKTDGIRIEGQNAVIDHCLIRDNTTYGIRAFGNYATVSNCTVCSNGAQSVYVQSVGCTLANNIICSGVSGNYAIYLNGVSISSDYNDVFVTNGAYTGYSGSQVTTTLTDWRMSTGQDGHTLGLDPLFVNAPGGDYHLQSRGGSYRSGSTWVADGSNSPCIDAGYGESGLEPAPNETPWREPDKGQRNLGAYGGTEQGSMTPSNRLVYLYEPIGGENYNPTAYVNIRWTWAGTNWQDIDTLALEYSTNSGSAWVPISGGAAVPVTNGACAWDVSALATGSLYRVRLTCNQDAAATARSAGDFRIRAPMTYYVNDASTILDEWCAQIGSAANSGTDPSKPKATVQSILDTYDLEPGDVVRIDTGMYDLTVPGAITVTNQDCGAIGAPVTFEASPYGVTINRKNAGDFGWNINGADYVTVQTATSTMYPVATQSWMKVMGGIIGLRAYAGNCRFSRLDVCSNNNTGVEISKPNAVIENCLIRETTNGGSGYGIRLGALSVVSNCTVSGSGKGGVYVSASGCVLMNSIVRADGAGDYGIYLNGVSLCASDCNDVFVTNGAFVGYCDGQNKAALAHWRNATGLDGCSLGLDPLFVSATGGDYHLRSRGGSYRGGDTWVADGSDSPCIDSGCGDAGFEPTPNATPWHGSSEGQRNLGAYGGTEQGSKTSSDRSVWLYAPVGCENFPDQASPVAVRWTWAGTNWQSSDTLRIEYSADSGATWGTITNAVSLTNGACAWDVSALDPAPSYRVRLTCNQDSAVTNRSGQDFKIGGTVYYVNDLLTVGDEWCTNPGNDGNSGTNSSSPKATIQAVLDAYDLEPGDRIRIDTGTYSLTGNITVTNQDSGSSSAPVILEASPYGVVIDRNNTGSGNYGFLVDQGGDCITIRTVASVKYPDATQRWMRVSGGYNGIYVKGGGCNICRVDVYSNNVYGIRVDGTNATIQNCIVRVTTNPATGCGIYCYERYASNVRRIVVSNCTVYGNAVYGIQLYNNDLMEMPVTDGSLRNNIVSADGVGHYAIHLGGVGRVLLGASDYNDLCTTNGACVGFYDSAARTNLTDWQLAMGIDGNSISNDPVFADAPAGDFHLKSLEGRYAGGGVWIGDGIHSPCIDSGDPASPWVNEPGPTGGRINMGAYGNTEQASKSSNTTTRTLVVASTPRGNPDPPEGIYSWYYGTITSCVLYGSPIYDGVLATQYVCAGWAGTGSVTNGTGTNTTFALTGDSTIAWQWQTNCYLALTSGANGSLAQTNGWHSLDSDVPVTALPTNYYHLAQWGGDTNGCDFGVNVLTARMTQARSVTADFAENLVTNGGWPTPEWWLAMYYSPGDFEVANTNDTDGDGLTGWEECFADTVPTNEQSVLAITNIIVDGADMSVHWKGGNTVTQYLEMRRDLTSEQWTPIFTNTPPTPTTTNYIDSVDTNTVRFYRVRAVR